MKRQRLRKFLPALAFSALLSLPAVAQIEGPVTQGLDQLAKQIVAKSKTANKTTIAVLPFPNADGSCSMLSNFIADELIQSLFNVPGSGLEIVERTQLDTLIEELKLGASGLLNPETTKRLGNLSGVGSLTVGTITVIGDTVRINARLIATDTGKAISAAAVDVPKVEAVSELLKQPVTTGPNCTSPKTETTNEATPQSTSGPSAQSVTASRIFSGPSQYPPNEFAAYGILAFRSRASSHDLSRYLMICEAYVASLPHASELAIPHHLQMATVWPINSDANADKINRLPRENICHKAVSSYGLVTALQALKDAELAGVDTSGPGPFLLAWSPSATKGRSDVLVLTSDLSNVTTFKQARSILLRWSRDIEQDPALWEKGWNIEKLRVNIRLWVDEYGPKVLTLFGIKSE
jgi:TolB-like protein